VESRQSFKGGLLRGYAKWLRDNGHLDGVLAEDPPKFAPRSSSRRS